MPNHTSLASLFSAIADAIRAKTGGSSQIVADDFPTAIAAIPSGGGGSAVIEELDVSASGTYTASGGVDGYSPVVVPAGTEGTPTAVKGTVSGNAVQITPKVTNGAGFIPGGVEKEGTPVTVTAAELVSGKKEITANGDDIDVTTFQKVKVAVNASVNIETTTKSNSDNTATSLAFTDLKGQPKAWFLRVQTQMSSGSTTYYYIVNMRSNGTNVTGNCFRMGSTRRVDNITSGYSASYSSGTLTISSTGGRTTSPGSFYNGTYELVYVY